MAWFLILVALFIVLAIPFALKYRGATLDTIEQLPGEKTMFEEDRVSFFAFVRIPGSTYPYCFVRITNKRIIVAQHALFGKKLPMRAILVHAAGIEYDTDISGTAKRGYPIVHFSPQQVSYETNGKKTWVKITTGSADAHLGGMPLYVRISTQQEQQYKKIFS